MNSEISLSPFSERPTLDQCISLWIARKTRRTDSEQTRRAYKRVITQFRAALHEASLELTSDARIVALAADGWANTGQDGTSVSSATYNQRLAILSSFYRYAMTWEFCMSNPIDLIERKPTAHPNAAMPMEAGEIAAHLQAIDRSTIDGRRDFALLSIGVTTGHRVNELAAMRWRDITVGQKITVIWPHCKGNKVEHSALSSNTAKALIAHLRDFYGEQLERIKPDSPIWVSQSNNNRGGPISDQAIADICKQWLGTSKVHMLRHSFAIAMEDAGASVAEISERLGHSDVKVTSIYLKRIRSARNPYASKLEEMFGIE
jgi:site-specific recombinase XerD